MPRAIPALPVVGLCILLAAKAFAAQDITSDAVTMATSRNLWTGDAAWLTDGRTPDKDPQAPAFAWDWIGLLAVSWPDPVRLSGVRVYLGEMSSYRLFAYAGGGFTQEGHRVGIEAAAYGREDMVPPGTTGWYEIPCNPEYPVDNISFQVIGGAIIYEMQFLAPDGTIRRPGVLKRGLFSLRTKISFLLGIATDFLSSIFD